MMKRVLVTLSGWMMISSVAIAQTDTITDRLHQLEGVTITETQRKHTVTSTAPLHLLDRKDMLTMGVTDIADALHRLPGITLRDYGGAGGMKTVSVRGFGAKHTGVSYDGVMLSECQSGEIDLSRYSLDNVESISLVIGDNDDIFIPARQSSVPAILNIQTLRLPTADTKPHLTTQVKFGSFGYISPFLRYEQNFSDKFAFSAMAEYTYAKNDYPFELFDKTDYRTNNRMSTGHGELNFLWNINKMNRLSGKMYYYDNDRQLPGVVHYNTNVCQESLHEQNFFGQLLYQTHNHSGWSLKWHAKFNWHVSDYEDPLIPNRNNDATYWQREVYTSAAVLYTPSEQWAFDYSADYAFNNLSSSSPRTVDSRPYRHTILQSATAKFHNQRLTVLGRLLYSLYLNDAKDGASARNMRRLSPSISLSYKLLPDYDFFVRASYKNIFRSPTFNESYYFHYGSTDLLPESTDQFNLGLTWKGKLSAFNCQLTADGYYNHVKDMIVAVPYNMFIWTCVNVGKVRVLGLDITANSQWQMTKNQSLVLSGSYSYQRAENRTNPTSPFYKYQIAYIPEHSGSVALGWENPWLSLSLHGSSICRRWANNQHTDGSMIDGYWDMGLTVWHTFQWGHQKLEARFDLKNLFDTQYEIVHFYPMPGRSWQISFKYLI